MDETFSGPVPIPTEVVGDGWDDDGDLLTPARARAARTKAEHGYWFRLPRTGGKALVRRISGSDRASIGSLPQHQQKLVLDALAKSGEQPSALRADGSINPAQWQRNAKANEEICNAYCVAGFLRPRLIFSEAERTDDSEVVVTDVDPHDRQLFFLWSETDNQATANLFRPAVDEAAQPDLVVETGGLGGGIVDAAVRPAGDAGGRVRQRRSA